MDSLMIALEDKQVLAKYTNGASAKKRFHEPEDGSISLIYKKIGIGGTSAANDIANNKIDLFSRNCTKRGTTINAVKVEST